MRKLEIRLTELGAMLNCIATKLDENFIKIEDRLDKIETRIGKMENRMGKIEDRLDKIENQMGKIENRLNVLTDETSTNFNGVGNRLGSIQAEIVKIGAATRYEQHHEDQKRFSIK